MMRFTISKVNFIQSVAVLLATWTVSCGQPAPKPQSTTAATASPTSANDEPQFTIGAFGVLPMAITQGDLPYLSKGNGQSTGVPCFWPIKKPMRWETQNPAVLNNIQANVIPIKTAILNWFTDRLVPDGGPISPSQFQAGIDKLIISHVMDSDVRLDRKQTCFTDQSMTLPQGNLVITTLFGAKVVELQTATGINRKLYLQLKKKARKNGITLTAVPTYQKARDQQGKVVRGKRGQPLFRAPDGSLMPAKKVPPMAKRPVFELKLTFQRGLYFAFGTLPGRCWKMEATKGRCDLNLVFDDPTPRIPECSQVKNMGFGVSESSKIDTEVIVKIAADNETNEIAVPYGQTKLLQAGGRYLAWVTPHKQELGAIVEIDSVVLNPTTDNEPLPQFSFNKKR